MRCGERVKIRRCKTADSKAMLLVSFLNQMTDATPSGPAPPQRVSLAALTVLSLRTALESGLWQGQLPGERELAGRLQVSRHTLRAALAELQREGLLDVSERSRRRIKIKAAKTSPEPRLIAVLSAEPLSALPPSLVVMIDELREKLAQAGYSFEFHVSQACFSKKPSRALEALTLRTPAAAWLLLGSLHAMQSWFARSGWPCLILGSCADGVSLPSIDADFRAACRHAGAMLLRKGHRSIVLVRPSGDFGGDLESEAGLLEALRGTPAASLRVLRHNGTPEHLCELLAQALHSTRPPTACVVARAVHVLSVMMFLMRRGLRVPEDVAVIARDDEMFLRHTVPAVTRYTASPARLAKTVFTAITSLTGKGIAPGTLRLIPQLIRGDSV